MTREEFVELAVANTMARYLVVYCSPYTVADAQRKCVQDAHVLYDRIHGDVIEEAADIRELSNGARHVYDPQRKSIVAIEKQISTRSVSPSAQRRLGR